jgi:aminoglycoside phosphotransferase (APT) family kinase protein
MQKRNKPEAESVTSPADGGMTDPAVGTLLGVGKEAEVFVCGAMVIKLYKPIAPKRSPFREAAILAMVESLGLSAPIVQGVRQVGNRWGVLMSRVEGPSLAEALIHEVQASPALLNRMARLQLQVHSHQATQFASLKSRLAGNIQRASILSESRQMSLLSGLAEMPDGDRLCHGDFHPYNIMGPLGHEILIDWLDASRGEPAADVCRSYVLLRPVVPETASAYVAAYCQASGKSRDAILSWLPYVAAARLAEGVPEVDDLIKMVDG